MFGEPLRVNSHPGIIESFVCPACPRVLRGGQAAGHPIGTSLMMRCPVVRVAAKYHVLVNGQEARNNPSQVSITHGWSQGEVNKLKHEGFYASLLLFRNPSLFCN